MYVFSDHVLQVRGQGISGPFLVFKAACVPVRAGPTGGRRGPRAPLPPTCPPRPLWLPSLPQTP